MTLFGIESIASIAWESVGYAYIELICALLFLLSWQFSRKRRTTRKSKVTKGKGEWMQQQGEKGETGLPGRARSASKKVIKLCSIGEVSEALSVYRMSVKASLSLSDAESCHELFVALVTVTIRASQVEETMHVLSDLRESGLGVSNSLFASAVRLCTSKQLFGEGLALLDFMNKDPNFTITDKSVWSCLLFCATEKKDFQRSVTFLERVKQCGTPSAKDFGNILRIVSARGDWDMALSLVKDMQEASVEIDQFDTMLYNTTLATCVAAGKVDQARALLDARGGLDGAADVITYNTIMKGYAKAGRIDDCFQLFRDMCTKGISPSQVTYGILLDCCMNENQMDRAMKVFDDIRAAGYAMNTILYTTLIKGFARAFELEKAMGVYQQMKADSDALPDLITFSILIKAHCETDNLEGALTLLEEMLSLGLRPDEVIFNTLIAGSGKHGNAKLGKALYDNMVKSGVRPSNATFSILIQLYQRCKLLEEAVTLLRDEPQKHRVEPEARLFLQLMQACIRERHGKQAVEVYGMLSERVKFTAAMHSSILSTCAKLNMYDTGADIIGLAAARGARVDACDTKPLLEAALKKGKTQVARSMLASMKALGHDVDPKLMQSIGPGMAPTDLPPWRSSHGDRLESAPGHTKMKRAVVGAC